MLKHDRPELSWEATSLARTSAMPQLPAWRIREPAQVAEVVRLGLCEEAICAVADGGARSVVEALIAAGFVMSPLPQVEDDGSWDCAFIRWQGAELEPPFLPRLPVDGLEIGSAVITHPRHSDLDPLLDADRDAATQAHAIFPPMTTNEGRRMLASAYYGWRMGPSSVLIVRDRSSQVPMAKLSLRRLVPPGVLDAGYMTFPDHRGNGIASLALRALANWLLGSVGIQRIELGIKPANGSSRRAAERAGFHLEARRTGRLRNADGSYDDELSYVAVSTHWRGTHA